MFNDTITIYNKYLDGATEKWQRTVIDGVFWDDIKGAVMRKTGASSIDSVQIIIPCLARVERDYMAPKEWGALSDKSLSWTLQDGDTVVKGNINYEIIKSTKELRSFDDVLIITSANTKSFGGSMAHWEVSGK